jgi:putative SOS response-associated peptidase YedK
VCGRYTYYPGELSDLHIQFYLSFYLAELKRRFNIAPGQNAPVIAAKEDGNSLAMLCWGLIPRWAKEASIGYAVIKLTSRPRASSAMSAKQLRGAAEIGSSLAI